MLHNKFKFSSVISVLKYKCIKLNTTTIFATNILIHGRIYNIDTKNITCFEVKHLQRSWFVKTQCFDV